MLSASKFVGLHQQDPGLALPSTKIKSVLIQVDMLTQAAGHVMPLKLTLTIACFQSAQQPLTLIWSIHRATTILIGFRVPDLNRVYSLDSRVTGSSYAGAIVGVLGYNTTLCWQRESAGNAGSTGTCDEVGIALCVNPYLNLYVLSISVGVVICMPSHRAGQ